MFGKPIIGLGDLNIENRFSDGSLSLGHALLRVILPHKQDLEHQSIEEVLISLGPTQELNLKKQGKAYEILLCLRQNYRSLDFIPHFLEKLNSCYADDPALVDQLYQVIMNWDVNPETKQHIEYEFSRLFQSNPGSKSQLRSDVKNFFEAALDPVNILSFSLAGLAFRGTRLSALNRMNAQSPLAFGNTGLFWNRGVLAQMKASSLGFLAETITFTAVPHLLRGNFVTRNEFLDDVIGNAIFLFPLKILPASMMRLRSFQRSPASLKAVLQSSAFTTSFMLGHDLQFYSGFVPQKLSLKENLYQSLLSQGHLLLGSKVAVKFIPKSWVMIFQKRELIAWHQNQEITVFPGEAKTFMEYCSQGLDVFLEPLREQKKLLSSQHNDISLVLLASGAAVVSGLFSLWVRNSRVREKGLIDLLKNKIIQENDHQALSKLRHRAHHYLSLTMYRYWQNAMGEVAEALIEQHSEADLIDPKKNLKALMMMAWDTPHVTNRVKEYLDQELIPRIANHYQWRVHSVHDLMTKAFIAHPIYVYQWLKFFNLLKNTPLSEEAQMRVAHALNQSLNTRTEGSMPIENWVKLKMGQLRGVLKIFDLEVHDFEEVFSLVEHFLDENHRPRRTTIKVFEESNPDFPHVLNAYGFYKNSETYWYNHFYFIGETLAKTIQALEPFDFSISEKIHILDIIYQSQEGLRNSGPDLLNQYFSMQIKTFIQVCQALAREIKGRNLPLHALYDEIDYLEGQDRFRGTLSGARFFGKLNPGESASETEELLFFGDLNEQWVRKYERVEIDDRTGKIFIDGKLARDSDVIAYHDSLNDADHSYALTKTYYFKDILANNVWVFWDKRKNQVHIDESGQTYATTVSGVYTERDLMGVTGKFLRGGYEPH